MGRPMNASSKGDSGMTAFKSLAETDFLTPAESLGFAEDASQFSHSVQIEETRTIYLDMTDLIEYVRSNTSLSGIQRVVASLIMGIEGYSGRRPYRKIIPVIPEYDNSKVFAVDPTLVIAMIAALEKARSDRGKLDRAIDAVYASRSPVELASGDTFAIAGAFWIYVHFDMVRRLREKGVKFVVFIHDLIQISHPEYVHEAATLVFRRSLVDVLMLADAVLTNSEWVAEDVRDFLRKHTTFELPVTAVPLATELQPPRDNKVLSEKVREIIGDPYVLSVSTIEVRKNHMYMVRIWEMLIKRNVPNIPLLVFVGKIGWDIEPFIKYLNSSDHLGGRLHVIHGVTDYELSELYKHAMFTIFPSYVEGFGLPVGESLAYGKPCIASNRSSMPEVGGTFARYVNPDDVNEGYAEVERLLSHPQELERWTREIRAEFRPKTWTEFVGHFFDTVSDVAQTDGRTINGVLGAGEIIGMGRDEIKRRETLGKRLIYLAQARVKGWHPVEGWGCWTSSRRATLRFPTALPPKSPITVYLMLELPDGTDSNAVSVLAEVGGVPNKLTGFKLASKWFLLDGKTGEDGSVEIVLVSAGPFGRPDVRELYVGLRAVAYCASKDTEARMSVLENIVLGGT
jgi:glycosyltransferase involved in cell wall biosynthesis